MSLPHKFADDTALVGLMSGTDNRAYLKQIESFSNYCDSNFLDLNVAKTKEMIIDFRRDTINLPPVIIKELVIDRVHSYKYLGVTLNDKLTWGDHVDALIKKLNPRLYCLRKLSHFNVCPEILEIFYTSTLEGVLRFCLICWGGNVSETEKNRINSIIKKASSVVGESRPSAVEAIYLCLLESKLDTIWTDTSHPLHDLLQDRQIGRGIGRLRLPSLKTNRHRNSFIPRAIKLFNDKQKR